MATASLYSKCKIHCTYLRVRDRQGEGWGRLIGIPFEIHLMAQVLTACQDEAQKQTKQNEKEKNICRRKNHAIDAS